MTSRFSRITIALAIIASLSACDASKIVHPLTQAMLNDLGSRPPEPASADWAARIDAASQLPAVDLTPGMYRAVARDKNDEIQMNWLLRKDRTFVATTALVVAGRDRSEITAAGSYEIVGQTIRFRVDAGAPAFARQEIIRPQTGGFDLDTDGSGLTKSARFSAAAG